jgi:F0F1-type ATP synthase delta subunit
LGIYISYVARVAGAVAAHILGTDVDNGSISAEELKTVMIEQYATFVAEVADRAMRILVRVKKLELAEEAQAALQQQFVDELTPLRGKVSLKKPERKTALVGKLADAIVDEVVLMIDEESKVSAGLIAKTAGAVFKAHHDEDVAILRAEAKDRVAEATAAHRAALAGKAAAGGSKKDKSSLAGKLFQHAEFLYSATIIYLSLCLCRSWSRRCRGSSG